MTVLIIKHMEIEGPGLIEDCLKEERIPYQILTLGSGIHPPKLDDFSAIVLLGGPMNVEKQKIENPRGSLLLRLISRETEDSSQLSSQSPAFPMMSPKMRT